MVSKPLRDGQRLTPRTSHRLIYPSRGRRGRPTHRRGRRPLPTWLRLHLDPRIKVLRLPRILTATIRDQPAPLLLQGTHTLTAMGTTTLGALHLTRNAEVDHPLQAARVYTSRHIVSRKVPTGESSFDPPSLDLSGDPCDRPSTTSWHD